jgi:hypothetical protein|tara:strand:+ start:362 stop:571 length:210 start_codon:yes stop_codon:yes gene_type:complete
MKLRVLQQRSPSLKEEYGYAESDYDNPIDNKPILQVLENDKWVDIPIVVEWEDCIQDFREPIEEELIGE